jgi:hypothetical protein
VIACPHQDAEITRRACIHLLDEKKPWTLRYYRRFTGVGLAYDVVCERCKDDPDKQIEAELRIICGECFEQISTGLFGGFLGSPAGAERATTLAFAHEAVQLAEPLPFRLLDIQPVEGLAQSVWVALTEQGGAGPHRS